MCICRRLWLPGWCRWLLTCGWLLTSWRGRCRLLTCGWCPLTCWSTWCRLLRAGLLFSCRLLLISSSGRKCFLLLDEGGGLVGAKGNGVIGLYCLGAFLKRFVVTASDIREPVNAGKGNQSGAPNLLICVLGRDGIQCQSAK